MRKIIISESNYESIVKKMKKITDKHYMTQLFYIFKDEGREDSWIYRGPRFVRKYAGEYRDRKGRYHFKSKLEFLRCSSFVDTTVHPFVEDQEMANRCGRSFIHLNTGCDSAHVLQEGNAIRFLPFGLGFVTYEKFSLMSYSTVDFFMIFGKIKSVEEELKKRQAEVEEYDEYMYKQDMEDMERELFDGDLGDNGYDEYEGRLWDDGCPEDLIDDEPEEPFGRSCFNGYLTPECAECQYWRDGSGNEIGCAVPYPIMECLPYAKMFNESNRDDSEVKDLAQE